MESSHPPLSFGLKPPCTALSLVLVLLLACFSTSHAQDLRALIESGEAKARAGHFSGAIEDYTRAIAAAPDYRGAYVHRAAARSLQ